MTSRLKSGPLRGRRSAAFSLMELLVVVAILLVLGSIAFPVYSAIRLRAHKTVALENLRQITGAFTTYTRQNDGTFPGEDAQGTDSWSNAAESQNARVWYNCLPRLLGGKGVGDYRGVPREFYTRENLLFLPGAQYPASDKKLVAPVFAFAINSKLQRKNGDGRETAARVSEITDPARTVIFLEQGIHGEPKAMSQQPKYHGSPKGSAKSFVARYGGQGVVTFVDGHAETVEGREMLTETGDFPFPPADLIWTRTPTEDPNQ